jgi:hypothetical protein
MLRAFGPPGFRVARSFAPLIPTPHSTHIFASPGNLRFPLSGLQKHHIQPERYAPLFCPKLSSQAPSMAPEIFKNYDFLYGFLKFYSKI